MDFLITFTSDFISDNRDVKPHNSGRVCFLVCCNCKKSICL